MVIICNEIPYGNFYLLFLALWWGPVSVKDVQKHLILKCHSLSDSETLKTGNIY